MQIDHLLNGFDETALWKNYAVNGMVNNSGFQLNWKIILLAVYCTILAILIIRSLKAIINIIQLKNRTEPDNLAGISIFRSEDISQPFSFLNWIFIPKDQNYSNIKSFILKHEEAHARQGHTLDLLFIEFIIVFLWFNPFVFFFRRSLKQVHEYLADSEAVDSNEVKADYLRSLVSYAGFSNVSGIASQFYWLTLKKRVKMITKNKTSKLYKLNYLLIIPLLVVAVLTFGNFTAVTITAGTKAENVPSIKPIQEGHYKITSEYGMRKHPITKEMKMHNGIDLAAETGTPVHATADGIVLKSEYMQNGYGKFLVIQHDQTYTTLYSQLSEFKVNPGDKVKKGDIIGLVGHSGISTGPHLHYEVWKNGEKVNPEEYFK